MQNESLPRPDVMALDRDTWLKETHLSQFVNAYYQFRDLSRCVGAGGKILIIGPGAGLDAAVLKWKGYEVVTFDIDEKFSPDFLGSCHDMPMFSDRQFDAVIASHVLEHLPLPYLDLALSEISRISRFAIVYLPVAGKHAKLSFTPKVFGLDFSFVTDVFAFWEKPSGQTLRYGGGQHYWEVGYRGFTSMHLLKRFDMFFDVLEHYRNKDWLPSYNFVLRSKQAPPTPEVVHHVK